ncbi:DUF2513 domain-containing protein [Pararhizobium mangrovi]|uniref:DUF2513 domain-containing protein n=1 Tax=Pararhizobium mangrovi TaxID=2590452 RepID=A0A506UCK2_9HYPH|nr:DUF2513 domain-containing protein [Pararhizobium mangrovi]TPW31328.1 DUF2513 domain-containing protein [Pararhizobium mangrovi]
MKRDDDYIRQLLLDMEASDDLYLVASLKLSMRPEEQKKHQHAELLCDAGFFEAVNKGVYRMTNQGHDYLNVIRDQTVWAKTKKGASSLGGATLGMMKDIAIAYVKKEAIEKLGIQI